MDSLDSILKIAKEEEEVRPVLLVDGDIVAYRAAAATDGRMYSIKDTPGLWKYKVDVVEAVKEKGLSLRDIRMEYHPEPLSHALNSTRLQMLSIVGSMEAKHSKLCAVEVYLTDSSRNFRLDINPTYKANREGLHRPAHLASCKGFLVRNYSAEYCGTYEADDKISIRAAELREKELPYIVCSIDKDLNQIPGYHFNWVDGKFWEVTEWEAREFLWHQVVTGDATDNILVPEGLGPAKAAALFRDVDWLLVSDDELFSLVTDLYSEFLGKSGKKKKDAGILPVKDFTDVKCWVEETMSQVKLLKEGLKE